MSHYRSTIWPEVSEPPEPTAAVLCIRSMVKPLSGEHRRYASIDEYTTALAEHFGREISVMHASDANWVSESVKEGLKRTSQGVLLVVEATEHVPAMITCLRVFDDVRHALAHETESYVARVTPVLVRDPALSHSIGAGGINGPAELLTNAQQRRIRVVDTVTAETRQRFKEFLEKMWPRR